MNLPESSSKARITGFLNAPPPQLQLFFSAFYSHIFLSNSQKLLKSLTHGPPCSSSPALIFFFSLLFLQPGFILLSHQLSPALSSPSTPLFFVQKMSHLDHHHGKVVVSLAMCPCIQLSALEEVGPSHFSKMPPAPPTSSRCRQLSRGDMKIVF